MSINGDFPEGEITRVVRADPVRQGLLFVGTETGIFCSRNDGHSWKRMGGGLPVVPVYDLKIKGADLIAGTHGRSFWILDDITPLRELADGNRDCRLFQPRLTVRTKLHFGALRSLRTSGVAHALAPGVGAGIRTFRRPDGSSGREYLDVGENPPNGAIVYYWLDESASGPLSLSFRDEAGTPIVTFRSDDADLPAAKRPTSRPGLNRFVWDLKYPGPKPLDVSLAPPRNKPLVDLADPPTGPTAVPGQYAVEMSIGLRTMVAALAVVKDPRLPTTLDGYRQQFDLLRELTASLGRLNATVNKIRRLKNYLAVLANGSGSTAEELTALASAATERLAAIEAVLVDVRRESPRDVLRNPAGLDDTLVDLISTVSLSDTVPTTQAAAVAKEVMARVEAEIGRAERLIETENAEVDRLALGRKVRSGVG